MEKEILKEIMELKTILARLVGAADLHDGEQFSIEALDKAAKEFKKLSIERGEWIKGSDISKYIKKAPWYAGKFIVNEFKFSNYFKKGQEFYFNKKDIIAVGLELKCRNVDLERYMEYIIDRRKFKKYLSDAVQNSKASKKKPFKLEKNVKDIEVACSAILVRLRRVSNCRTFQPYPHGQMLYKCP